MDDRSEYHLPAFFSRTQRPNVLGGSSIPVEVMLQQGRQNMDFERSSSNYNNDRTNDMYINKLLNVSLTR
jgi:hypothetical protein